MMKFYNERVLPWAINRVMAREIFSVERAKMVPMAAGTVLEIGVGSGFNMPYYSPHVKRLFCLEPSERLKKISLDKVSLTPFPVTFVGLTAEHIPLDDQSVDTVVSTWTLCTVPDVNKALAEIFRLLKPDGRFLFIEHGCSPDRLIQSIQSTLNPLWKRIGGGCNLNRPMDKLIEQAGFRISHRENGYMDGAGPLIFLFRGTAKKCAPKDV
ncbi:MAG: methyltransferase type 11 [Magnetococcales bacterium]|nr:methyltransferase type 11 [Magnetococcales bacterium]HIJ82599.1 class I SAM-dependent methyltransferase [Magnetococcales bacterium]